MKKNISLLEEAVEALTIELESIKTIEIKCTGCEIQVGSRDMTGEEMTKAIRQHMFYPELIREEKNYKIPVMMPTNTVVSMIMLHQGIEMKHTQEHTKKTQAQTIIVNKVKKPSKKTPKKK